MAPPISKHTEFESLNQNLHYKVCRDPVHEEIRIYPLEILCTDSVAIQRLRQVSQLSGAALVYPGATHTRFLHSLGVMQIASMYAAHFQLDPAHARLLRMAGLMHDIGHGPFSHQFDEIAYHRAGLEEGHDQQREQILMGIMPQQMADVWEGLSETWKKQVQTDLSSHFPEITEKPIQSREEMESFCRRIMEQVCTLFYGEMTGSADFNMIQGPLGADRLDFVIRDAYYCGTPQYGTVDLWRIIRNARIQSLDGKTVLAYDSKIIDNIYSVLFGRFMMYKNVYFHKTARAADLMLQKIIDLSYGFLEMNDAILHPEQFMSLTDGWLLQGIHHAFLSLDSYDPVFHDSIQQAHDLLKRYESRRLWKCIMEITFSTTGVDPSLVANSVGEDVLRKIEKNLRARMKDTPMEPEEIRSFESILSNFDTIFHIDTPYKLSLAHPAEFLASEVYLSRTQDQEISLVRFNDFLEDSPLYKSVSGNLVQMVRIYVAEDVRDFLRKHSIIPAASRVHLTTRW